MWISSHSQPAVRPGCARCRVLKITQNNRLMRRIYETIVPKTIFLLRHGDSFILPYITFYASGISRGIVLRFSLEQGL